MTTIERFQNLQVELVRAGFGTDFMTRPNGSDAKLTLYVALKDKTAENVEYLDQLAAGHGFGYTLTDDSRAALSLLEEPAKH
jgi:hypothetical protein